MDKAAEVPREIARQKWIESKRPPMDKALIGSAKGATRLTAGAIKLSWRTKLIHGFAIAGIALGAGTSAGKYYEKQFNSDDEVQGQVLIESREKLEQKPTNFELLYPDLHEEEKLRAISDVQKARAELNEYYPANAAEKLLQYEDIIRARANEFGVPEDILLGVLYIESAGDKNAYNHASGAKGLGQLTKIATEGSLGPNGEPLVTFDDPDDPAFNSDSLFDPNINIYLTAQKLRDNYNLVHRWDLTLDIYQRGYRNNEGLESIAFQSVGVVYPTIFISPEDDSQQAVAEATAQVSTNLETQRKLRELYRMGSWRRDNNREVAGILAQPEWDNAPKYNPRVMAAIDIIYEYKTKQKEGNLQPMSQIVEFTSAEEQKAA